MHWNGGYQMEKMKFENFIWPQNPEVFQVDAEMEPLYTIAPDGSIHYDGLGPLCRVIRGSGIFQGRNAAEYFNTLSVYMAAKLFGKLIHPIWGTFQVYLVELKMKQISREDYIEYAFTFREADPKGVIPMLPGNRQ